MYRESLVKGIEHNKKLNRYIIPRSVVVHALEATIQSACGYVRNNDKGSTAQQERYNSQMGDMRLIAKDPYPRDTRLFITFVRREVFLKGSI